MEAFNFVAYDTMIKTKRPLFIVPLLGKEAVDSYRIK